MLIEAPYKVGDTVSLKLSSGEEIVARLESESKDQYTLKRPMMLVMNGQGGVGLGPYMMSVNPEKGNFVVLASSVACIAKTDEQISKTYIEQTTGLKLN